MPFVDAKLLDEQQRLPGWHGRVFHSELMTFAYYEIDAGSSLHVHAHEQEEVWHVIDGELEFTLDGETTLVGSGCAAIVPAFHEHGARATKRTTAIVVDTPRRDDFGGASTG
jgi:mannose-6-phosphate isomerase-like protein (cupin superfamily)